MYIVIIIDILLKYLAYKRYALQQLLISNRSYSDKTIRLI